ncbi:MAG: hypothetical protein NZ942_02805 [Candidatus Aenigmarchaeota archaeon]|nr:hypothetical protein [Candidatus Aenigmarchaeota archaeon]
MRLKVRYIGRANELFGSSEKEELLYLPEKACYKDAIQALREKFLARNKDKVDFLNEVILLTKEGRILKNIENQPIATDEILVGYLIAGG